MLWICLVLSRQNWCFKGKKIRVGSELSFFIYPVVADATIKADDNIGFWGGALIESQPPILRKTIYADTPEKMKARSRRLMAGFIVAGMGVCLL